MAPPSFAPDSSRMRTDGSATLSVAEGQGGDANHPLAGGFERVVLPNLRPARRLARRLTNNEHDADDVVQEAALRALRYFRTFKGGNGRAWFLRIVRNTFYAWRQHGSSRTPTDPFDETRHRGPQPPFDPEQLLSHADDLALIERAMKSLPGRYRELLGLRELMGLSYQELAAVVGIPLGTVMSSLSRARPAFRRALQQELKHSGIARGRDLSERGAERRASDRIPCGSCS